MDRYENPNVASESGADVVAVINGHRIGIQVTDLDAGKKPAKARGEESKLARNSAMESGAYSTWGQNDPSRILDAIVRSVSDKAKTSSSGFNEFWLLICCGVPALGAVASTFAMTPWIDLAALDIATVTRLSTSTYSRAFIYVILGVEEQALYQWQRGGGWSKSTLELQTEEQPSELLAAASRPGIIG